MSATGGDYPSKQLKWMVHNNSGFSAVNSTYIPYKLFVDSYNTRTNRRTVGGSIHKSAIGNSSANVIDTAPQSTIVYSVLRRCDTFLLFFLLLLCRFLWRRIATNNPKILCNAILTNNRQIIITWLTFGGPQQTTQMFQQLKLHVFEEIVAFSCHSKLDQTNENVNFDRRKTKK